MILDDTPRKNCFFTLLFCTRATPNVDIFFYWFAFVKQVNKKDLFQKIEAENFEFQNLVPLRIS
ncbi:UNVERIFIED_CONTAM: hypothetical protein NCL1_10742 [Trichonephila clavipes]